MPTETQQMLEQLGLLTDAFHGKVAEIDDTLATVAARYQGFFSTVYVDQVNGNDGNVGTHDAPVASIQRAIDLSPHDGFNSIMVRGDYNTSVRFNTNGRTISIVGCAAGSEWDTANDPAQRPTLTIGYYDAGGYAEVAGFHCGYDAFIDIVYFNIQLPSLAAVNAALPGINTGSTGPRGLFGVRSSSHGRPGSVSLRYGELLVPADYYGALLNAVVGWYLYTASLTISGDISGKVHPSVPAASNANDVSRYVQTTLATL